MWDSINNLDKLIKKDRFDEIELEIEKQFLSIIRHSKRFSLSETDLVDEISKKYFVGNIKTVLIVH